MCYSHRLQVPDLFLGTIIIPIVGNAAEHAAAIIFAAKNKMELSLGIAVGSATQIALFVVPLTVVIAWWADQPLSLDFHPFETATLLMTVLLVGFITQVSKYCIYLSAMSRSSAQLASRAQKHTCWFTSALVGSQTGESNWLQGVMLIIAYCIVACGFFVHVDTAAVGGFDEL